MINKHTFLENKEILVFVFLYLTLQFFFFTGNGDIWWDAAVYDGMGRYIYSGGYVGLWESNRPLVWPLILGFFWKIGFNEVLFGKIITILFVGCSILLTYKIAKDIFGKNVAIFSAIFLSLFPTFFLYTHLIQTEIPSTLFFLLGIFFFMREKYSLAGFFLGISVMTRFFQIFIVFPVLLYLLYLTVQNKTTWKNIKKYIFYFSLPVVIYCTINIILYKNPFYPFILQAYMTTYTGWIFHQKWFFYFVSLWKENIFILFVPLSILLLVKKDIEQKVLSKKGFIAILFIVSFLSFVFTAHKEVRILIPLFPFLSILIAYGFVYLVEKIENKKIAIGIAALFLCIWLFSTIPQLKGNLYDDNLDPFYDFIQGTTNNNIWISNPAFLIFTDKKAEELIYYPLYNTERIKQLQHKTAQAQMILLNTCDLLPCPPTDSLCPEAHEQFLEQLKTEFIPVLDEQHNKCIYYIFKKEGS